MPANGHTEVVDEAVAPICTSAGLTEGTHCLVCQTVLVSQQKISAMGHVYRKWTFAGKHTHSADCTRSGCRHVETVNCPLYEIQVDDAAFDVCPVCGACDRVTFERIKQAVCTNIDQNAIPSGVLFVYGAESPFGTKPAAIQGLSEFCQRPLCTDGYLRKSRISAGIPRPGAGYGSCENEYGIHFDSPEQRSRW